MALDPWYRIVTLRQEVREGRSFSPDEFAIAPEQVVAKNTPEDYSDPTQFFSRTCFTRALSKEHAGMVLRRLSDKTENTVPFVSLAGRSRTSSIRWPRPCTPTEEIRKRWRFRKRRWPWIRTTPNSNRI